MVTARATGCRSCTETFGNHYGRRPNAPRRCHDAKYDHNCEWGSTLYGTFWNVARRVRGGLVTPRGIEPLFPP